MLVTHMRPDHQVYIQPKLSVFLFLYVKNVACWATGCLGFIIGHSVPSTITLVLENFVLKDDGEKYLTQSLDGHQSISSNSASMDSFRLALISLDFAAGIFCLVQAKILGTAVFFNLF